MAIVYQATNLVNGKRYIGVTQYTLGDRVSKHFYDAKNKAKKTRFANALNKYGRDMFRWRTLLRCETYDEVLRHEFRLIALLKPEYNILAGGAGSVGFRHTAASLQKMSESQRGRPGFWKGKKLPVHVAAAIRERMNKPENKEPILRCRHLGVISRMRKVVCLDDGVEYESAQSAAERYGASASLILKVCQKTARRRSAGGRVFRFAEDIVGRKDDPEAVKQSGRLSQLSGLDISWRTGGKNGPSA